MEKTIKAGPRISDCRRVAAACENRMRRRCHGWGMIRFGFFHREEKQGVSSIPQTGSASSAPLYVPPECLPDVEHLVIEDDTPVDSLYSEKLMRLLVASLYATWLVQDAKKRFLAAANVGIFYTDHDPPIVPDVLLSLDIDVPRDLRLKKNRSYFTWIYGKSPDATLEIVSNKEGRELDEKMEIYARLNIPYYIVWDPEHYLTPKELHCFSLRDKRYHECEPWFPGIGLGVKEWRGEYEAWTDTWLRWCDERGQILLTAEERALKLAAQLRSLGVEPQG
jgi:hypothetical protein